jgi:hypothetical protein
VTFWNLLEDKLHGASAPFPCFEDLTVMSSLGSYSSARSDVIEGAEHGTSQKIKTWQLEENTVLHLDCYEASILILTLGLN